MVSSAEGNEVVGVAVVGDAVVGDAVVGDAVVGDAVVGDAVFGGAVGFGEGFKVRIVGTLIGGNEILNFIGRLNFHPCASDSSSVPVFDIGAVAKKPSLLYATSLASMWQARRRRDRAGKNE